MTRILRAILLDPRVVSSSLASLLIPVDVAHGQIPWQYNTLADWATTTLLSVACGQALAVCVIRSHSRRWWVFFFVLLFLHFTDLLYAALLFVTMILGRLLPGHLMGASSNILGVLFVLTTLIFVVYHYVLASAARPDLPILWRLFRTFCGLSLALGLLILGCRFTDYYPSALGRGDHFLYFGARAIIPYGFWLCLRPFARQAPVRSEAPPA